MGPYANQLSGMCYIAVYLVSGAVSSSLFCPQLCVSDSSARLYLSQGYPQDVSSKAFCRCL